MRTNFITAVLCLVSVFLWLELPSGTSFAQTNVPAEPVPSRTILTNGLIYSKEKSKAPSTPGAQVSCPDTPFPYTNFLALDRASSHFIGPPDTEGTIGNDYVMTVLNHEVQIQTRGGGSVLRVA